MIHTGGEQIQGNETRNVRDWRPRLGENRGGWVGKLDSTSSLRLEKDPRWAREVGNVRLYSCHSRTARLRGSGLLAPRRRMATIACSMPASVYSRVARKRKFSTLSLRSAVENGSFVRMRSGDYLGDAQMSKKRHLGPSNSTSTFLWIAIDRKTFAQSERGRGRSAKVASGFFFLPQDLVMIIESLRWFYPIFLLWKDHN